MAGDEGARDSPGMGGRLPGILAPVFISYASQDASIANALVASLEEHGIKCWIAPRNVTPGSQYADEIVAAINDATIAILVLSEHAIASPHVGREIERAASKRRGIIVLRTDAAPLARSFEYFLSDSQWVDVAALGVPAAVARITQAVRQRVAASSWVSPGLGTDARNPADRRRRPSYLTVKRLGLAAIFLLVAGVVLGVLFRYWPSKEQGPQSRSAGAPVEKSIAVLPFVDMSEKNDQEYFANGMAEEIIDLLVKIPALKVISRTSSFQFQGQAQDLRRIGASLGVTYVLEGSVRKSGDRLRVTAQLIDSRDGVHLLSQTYDRDLVDVLKMQDEIAVALVRALKIQVGADGLVARPALRNTQAYALYLQGRQAYERFDLHGFEQAVNCFERALELDPSFAEAAVALAAVYNYLGETEPGFMPSELAFKNARHAAEIALKLEPNLGIAHAMLGSTLSAADWDWTGADRELKLALALAPNDVYVSYLAARQSMIMGRWDEALKLLNASLERDPLNPRSYVFLSAVQLRRGRLTEAEIAARRILEISPTQEDSHAFVARVLLVRGEWQAALTEYLKEPDETLRVPGIARAYFALQRKADSDAALTQALNNKNLNCEDIALIYSFRGELDEAFKWLQHSYERREAALLYFKGDPEFKNLMGDPRYKALLEKMQLSEG